MRKIILSFLLIITLLCSMPIYVCASSDTNTEINESMSGMDVFILKGNNFLQEVLETIGIVFNPMKWGEGLLKDRYIDYMCESYLIDNSSSYEDWINSHLKVTERGIEADSEFVDSVYEFAVNVIEKETGFFIIPTLSTNELIASSFYNKDTMDAFKKYINDSGSDIVFVHGGLNSSGAPSGFRANKIIPNVGTTSTAESVYTFLRVPHDWGIINSNGVQYSNTIPYLGRISLYDSSWNAFTSLEKRDFDFLSVNALVPYCNTHYWYEIPSGGDVSEACYYQTDKNGQAILTSSNIYFTIDNSPSTRIFTADGRDIRIYKTLDDFKNYSVGTRPYYITDKFQDYDINGDNSCIVTESDLSNGSVYGDVYNYIINNYDNPDSLTEDELRDILNDYLGQGNGSGSGSDNSGNSGNGLSGFLSGLGSIGDAILSILGKLLEYVGKAVELLSGTVTKVLDIVPKSITNLFGAFFSFLPEECMTYIELGLALGVILAIVGAFKK